MIDTYPKFLPWTVLVATIATSMAGLSAVPHQEARFLTPMLVPMTLLYTWDDVKPKLLFWVIGKDSGNVCPE